MKKQNTSKYTEEQLREALYRVHDTFERVLVPYFLTRYTAYDVVNGEHLQSRNKLTVGVQSKYLTKEVMSTLKNLMKGAIFESNKILWVYKDIPIEVQIFKRSNKVLNHLNTVHYYIETFNVPNPFKNYWKARGVLR